MLVNGILDLDRRARTISDPESFGHWASGANTSTVPVMDPKRALNLAGIHEQVLGTMTPVDGPDAFGRGQQIVVATLGSRVGLGAWS